MFPQTKECRKVSELGANRGRVMKQDRYLRSRDLYERSKKSLAGGVSSSIRAGDKPFPLFFDRGSGSRIVDADNNEYIDYVLGRGPLILGHSHTEVLKAVRQQLSRGQIFAGQHELEIRASETIQRIVPCAELVRYSNSGSEAVHAALRLARAFTGRQKVIKFEGHYHGWLDNILFSFDPSPEAAGPPESPFTVPESSGQPQCDKTNMIVLPWNNVEALEKTVAQLGSEIAAIIMEPVMCNSGVSMPQAGYLASVRGICDRHGIVLIFDEVITGFRLSLRGAQGYFGVTPDLAIFGKAMASGFPLGCLAGRRHVMQLIAEGKVVHSGTFNSNPVTMAAALKTLELLEKDEGAILKKLQNSGQHLIEGIRSAAKDRHIPLVVQGHGSIFFVGFQAEHNGNQMVISDYRQTLATNQKLYERFVCAMLDKGVRLIPGGKWFLSGAHTEEDIERTVRAVGCCFAELE